MGRIVVFLVVLGTVCVMSDFYYAVAIVLFALATLVYIGIQGKLGIHKFYDLISADALDIVDTLSNAVKSNLLSPTLSIERITSFYRMIDMLYQKQFVVQVNEQLVREFEMKYNPQLPNQSKYSASDRALMYFFDSAERCDICRVFDIKNAILVRRRFPYLQKMT